MPDDQAPSRPRELNAGFEQNVRILTRDMVTGRLVIAARGLLDWGQAELAERAGIRRQTLAELEGDIRRPQVRVRDAVLSTLENEGVRFVDIGGAWGPVLNFSSRQS
ncbi:helix-turn-helix domain-containing protein [Bosea sp. UC22_33]|uniref:helix-turn-helix domain-containing protein n=1 Tax=Bosea sp. UC22_33 TaxID=3350165 RepID=UPI00367050FF